MSDQSDEGTISFCFVGDVCVPSHLPASEAESIVRSAHRVIPPVSVLSFNLEGPLSMDGRVRTGRSVILSNHHSVGALGASAGKVVCCLANNHIMDFGDQGLARTTDSLDRWRISYFGAGRNEEEAGRPVAAVLKGRKVVFLGFTTSDANVGSIVASADSPGCASFKDEDSVIAVVRRATAESQIVCVQLHWGMEFYHYPTEAQVGFARRIVAAGARVVVGHHAHVIQPVERYGDGLIAYGLGNFLFPRVTSTTGRVLLDKAGAKSFCALICGITTDGRVDGELLIGRRNADGRIRSRSVRRTRYDLGRHELIPQGLDLSAYRKFWRRYRARRARTLLITELRDMILKAFVNSPSTLLGTLDPADWRRLISRMRKLMRR